MATIAPAPLNQALSRKKANPLPAILLSVGLIIAIVAAILGYLESRRTQAVTVLIHDVPYGQQITAEDVGTVEVSLHRPTQLAGMTDPSAIIGQYAARNLGANDLLQPSMVMIAPPTQPVYPNGEQLTPNMVPVPFATTTVGPITYRDRLNIGFSDPSGAPDLCDQAHAATTGTAKPSALPAASAGGPVLRPYACRLLSYVRILYVDANTAYLEMTPYQAQTVWALQSAGLQLWGERYGTTSDTLPALNRLDIGQVTTTQLIAPVPTPQVRPTAAAIPGGTSAIPGSVQPTAAPAVAPSVTSTGSMTTTTHP